MNFGNKWEPDESDEEYEDEYAQNEVLPPGVDEIFRNNVLNVKHILYDNTILKPELGTSDAQNNKVLADYLKHINHIYILSMNAQKGIMNENDLNGFPEKVRGPLKQMLTYLADYFKKNRVPDTIPYEDYINKSFKEYQFVQDNSFE